MKLKMLATGVVAAAALFTASCGIGDDGGNADGKHLNLVTVFEANTTDPHLNHTSFILNSGAVETLVGLDPETAELYGWLAEDWSSDDAVNWTFTIRDNVTFHNGSPVTAEAVRKSLQNSIDVNPGMAAALKIASMDADGQTLRIRTDGEYASLPSQLVHYNSVIVDTDAEGELPIGTGAFAFTAFDINGTAKLERYDGYWDGTAKLDSVDITANEDANSRMLSLQSGQADVIYRPSLESLGALESTDDLTVDTVPGARVYHLTYNYSGPNAQLWGNPEFRRGIDALVDRTSITDTVLKGRATATDNAFPTEVPPSPGTNFDADPAAALEHFGKAGLDIRDGKVSRNGAPLELTVATYIARPELPQIAQALQAEAAKVGINVTIHNAENIDEYLLGDDWDIATYSLATLTRGDGSYFFNGTFLPGGAQNHGDLEAPELISMIEEFNATVDADARTALREQIALYLRDNAINSYIVSPFETAAYKDTVRGWITPSNEFEFQMVTKDLDIE